MIISTITHIYKSYLSLAKKYGHIKAVREAISIFLYKVGAKVDPIKKRKREISNKFDQIFESTVRYGPFRGLKLSRDSWWGSTDRASMLFGIYEKEVLVSLQNLPRRYKLFIDLGAGEGYYAVGVLKNNLFESSICFEVSEKGREAIYRNSIINAVENRIEIRGLAKDNFYREFDERTCSGAVLFVDIEGAEFDLLCREVFHKFRSSVIFVEIHDWYFPDGEERLRKLKSDSKSTHFVTELRMGSRDLSVFPELEKLNDDDRWIICSEGRGQLMTWLRFDPIVIMGQ